MAEKSQQTLYELVEDTNYISASDLKKELRPGLQSFNKTNQLDSAVVDLVKEYVQTAAGENGYACFNDRYRRLAEIAGELASHGKLDKTAVQLLDSASSAFDRYVNYHHGKRGDGSVSEEHYDRTQAAKAELESAVQAIYSSGKIKPAEKEHVSEQYGPAKVIPISHKKETKPAYETSSTKAPELAATPDDSYNTSPQSIDDACRQEETSTTAPLPPSAAPKTKRGKSWASRAKSGLAACLAIGVFASVAGCDTVTQIYDTITGKKPAAVEKSENKSEYMDMLDCNTKKAVELNQEGKFLMYQGHKFSVDISDEYKDKVEGVYIVDSSAEENKSQLDNTCKPIPEQNNPYILITFKDGSSIKKQIELTDEGTTKTKKKECSATIDQRLAREEFNLGKNEVSHKEKVNLDDYCVTRVTGAVDATPYRTLGSDVLKQIMEPAAELYELYQFDQQNKDVEIFTKEAKEFIERNEKSLKILFDANSTNSVKNKGDLVKLLKDAKWKEIYGKDGLRQLILAYQRADNLIDGGLAENVMKDNGYQNIKIDLRVGPETYAQYYRYSEVNQEYKQRPIVKKKHKAHKGHKKNDSKKNNQEKPGQTNQSTDKGDNCEGLGTMCMDGSGKSNASSRKSDAESKIKSAPAVKDESSGDCSGLGTMCSQ